MRTNILSLIVCIAAALALYSCHDDKPLPVTEDKTGTVDLSSFGVEVEDKENVAESRATVDLSNYIVKISSIAGTAVREWSYQDVPEVMTLAVGKYKIDVESHKLEKAGWDCPYYFGSKEFEILENSITDIGTITCTFRSIRVSIFYSEALYKQLGEDTRVTVECNDEGVLTFTPTEKRSGYFAAVPGSTTLVATFRSVINGGIVEQVTTIPDVKGGTHYKITFKLNREPEVPTESGGISADGEAIKVDSSVIGVDRNGNIVIEDDTITGEQRPGHEDGGDEPTPPEPGDDDKFDIQPSNGLSFTTANSPEGWTNDKGEFHAWSEENPCMVTIKSKAAINNLEVTIKSSNKEFISSAGEMLPLYFDLAELDKNSVPGSDIASLGLPVGNEVRGKNEVPFNITTLAPLLAGFEGSHTFILKVTDVNGASVSRTLTFVTK